MMKNKKGQVMQNLGALGVGIATLAIVLVVTFLIISQAQTQIAVTDGISNVSDVTSRTTAYNATVTLSEAVDTIPGWVPLIVIASIGGLLLGLVTLYKRR